MTPPFEMSPLWQGFKAPGPGTIVHATHLTQEVFVVELYT
jgi:hypothetical protein